MSAMKGLCRKHCLWLFVLDVISVCQMLSCSKTQSGGNCKSQLESGPVKLVPGSLKPTLAFSIQHFAVLNSLKAGSQGQTHGGKHVYIMGYIPEGELALIMVSWSQVSRGITSLPTLT